MTSPAFQFYVQDFLTGTMHMSAEEIGAYILLLCHQWDKGALPASDKELMRLSRSRMKVLEAVKKKFVAGDDGLLRNERMEKEREKQASYHNLRSEQGKKGNEIRWQKHNKAKAEISPGDNQRVAEGRSSSSTSFSSSTSDRDISAEPKDFIKEKNAVELAAIGRTVPPEEWDRCLSQWNLAVIADTQWRYTGDEPATCRYSPPACANGARPGHTIRKKKKEKQIMSDITLQTTWTESVTQPIRFLQRLAIRSEAEALSSTLPALAQIRRALGDDGEIAVQAILTKLIQDLVSFFNVGKTMNDAQCAETVRLVLAEYYYLHLGDLKLCFDRLKAGRYGRSYDRIDGQVILLALEEYSKGRMASAETLSRASHRAIREGESEDYYYLRITGEKGAPCYIRDIGDSSYTEVDRADATAFSYRDAYALKRAFGPEMHPELVATTQPDEGLVEWMRIHAPSMLRTTQRADYIERRCRLMDLKAEMATRDLSQAEISER